MNVSKEDAFEIGVSFGFAIRDAEDSQDVKHALEESPFPQIQMLADQVTWGRNLDMSICIAKNLIQREIG